MLNWQLFDSRDTRVLITSTVSSCLSKYFKAPKNRDAPFCETPFNNLDCFISIHHGVYNNRMMHDSIRHLEHPLKTNVLFGSLLFFRLGRRLLNPIGGQDLWQMNKVRGIWVTVPERDKMPNEMTPRALLFCSSGPTHRDLPPCSLVLCGMQSQVTLLPVSFSTTVKVSPRLKALSSLGSSFLAAAQSGRNASNTSPRNGFPGDGWPSWRESLTVYHNNGKMNKNNILSIFKSSINPNDYLIYEHYNVH